MRIDNPTFIRAQLDYWNGKVAQKKEQVKRTDRNTLRGWAGLIGSAGVFFSGLMDFPHTAELSIRNGLVIAALGVIGFLVSAGWAFEQSKRHQEQNQTLTLYRQTRTFWESQQDAL